MANFQGFGSQILSQVLKKRILMADRAKGIFIANISHELRSPLHGILASAEFISDTRLDTLQRTFVDTIDSCGRTLLDVINHVLDFGKLTYIARLKNKVSRPHIQRSTSKETVPQNIDAAPMDLMAVAEQVVESCYAGYEFKGLFGQVDIGTMLGDIGQKMTQSQPKSCGYGRAKDPTSSLTVVIDVEYRERGWYFELQSGALQRILMNITGNALKYTSSGWVRVQLSASESDHQTTVNIMVSDSGKGISADFLKNRMFSPFSQEDTLQAGTGLGMSIVKQVAEKLGGEINVTSQVNVGTQVSVSLPATPVDRPQSSDSCTRLQSLAKDMKIFLAGFDKTIPASRLLYQSISNYLTNWYDMQIVDDVYFSDLIISDECPELLDYFQQCSPSERSAFSPNSPYETPMTTPDSAGTQNVYRAWQPLVVLCSNALRYEFFGEQAETGKIIDFSSKPCGPYKLARSLLFCLEQVETRRHSLEEMMQQTSISSPLIRPSSAAIASTPNTLSSAVKTSSEDYTSPLSDQSLSQRHNSFGRGVVRFSPAVRQGSSDRDASMYVPGHGFVAAPNSSIVEPQQFVGMRRKSAKPQITPKIDDDPGHFEEPGREEMKRMHDSKLPTVTRTSPAIELQESTSERAADHPIFPQSPSLYNPRSTLGSVLVLPKFNRSNSAPHLSTSFRPPYVLIVEDNSVNALILATFLRKRAYPFAQAENGLLAVQAVQARKEGFDVILMDIQSISFTFARLIYSAGHGWISSYSSNSINRTGATNKSSCIYRCIDRLGGGERSRTCF
jgi:signal transduction histidine kinase